MEITRRFRNILTAIFALFLFASCSTSEDTVVIEDAPTSSDTTDTTQQQPAEQPDDFQQIRIGENRPIRSLDPLFVENASSMRAVQMLYEGLVSYNADGEIIPAVAKSWEASDNQRTYRFILKNNVYYHDSDIFSAGRGRRLVAEDVKKTFERMAKSSVPQHAAKLFMNIEGFEPYFSEQQEVMLPGDRQLSGVSGIRAPNDSTVVFSLVNPDDAFLNKLASPYAVIYPQEAVQPNNFNAVGTGPFKLSQKRSDSLFIFSRFDDYRIDGQPRLNRVDFRTSSNESVLLNALKGDQVHLMPDLSPLQMRMMLNENGQLTNSFQEGLKLYQNEGVSGYNIRYNTGADVSKSAVVNALQNVSESDFSAEISANIIDIRWSLPEAASDSTAEALTATYSGDPIIRTFYSWLSERLGKQDIEFNMSSTRIRNRNTPLYVDNYIPFRPEMGMQTSPDNTLVVIQVKSPAVADENVSNLKLNSLPWWIDLRETTLSSTNTR